MEEKRYPELNEEQGMDMCCEPAAEAVGNAPTSVNGVTKVHDWIDDLDWDRFPSYGPFSEEEAVARIDRFEERLAKGEVRWTSSEEFTKQLYERVPMAKIEWEDEAKLMFRQLVKNARLGYKNESQSFD